MMAKTRKSNPTKRKRGAKAPAKPRRGSAYPLIGKAIRGLVIVAIWLTVSVGAILAWYGYDLPSISGLETPARRSGMTLLSADGSVLATFGDLYANPIRLHDLPKHVVNAVIATEDRRFFSHFGVDPWALFRAAIVNVRSGKIRQGGSTITQQLAKNLFLTPERTLRRKIQELLLALWLEAQLSKEQILTVYLNRVYLGSGTYGIGAAARRFFDKPASKLGVMEGAIIAGLLKAPSKYSPLVNREAAIKRGLVVLKNMVDAGYLTGKAAERARRSGPRRMASASYGQERYFADWVLERAAGYVGRAGQDLVVVTTLDKRLQKLASDRSKAILAKYGGKLKASQVALVSMSPDGAVRAMIGGRDYRRSQYNRATQAHRQPGSAFKLFVYLAGIEAGLNDDSVYTDRPIDINGWRPRNYDGRYQGRVTLRTAFARSLNSVAVQVSEFAGRDNVIGVARRLGITSDLAGHPSLALGTDELTLLELTGAYAVVANGGHAIWPYGIEEIRDRTGRVLFRRSGAGGGSVVSRASTETMRRMLRAVVDEGTGKSARLSRPAAGKTGTSQEFRDAWFLGFADDVVAGVWVGNDDSSPMKGVTGGRLPALIWRDFVDGAIKAPRAMRVNRR